MKEEVYSILEEATVSYQDVYEMTYVNKASQKKVFHIFDVEFSNKKNPQKSSLIKAYILENRSDEKTSFSCSNVISISKYWKTIIDKDATAPEDGLYIFTCRGDNHLEEEMYYLNKGERLYKYFEGENSHMNGWFEVMPLAFHFIKPYNPDEESSMWQEINCIKEHEADLFIAATAPNCSLASNFYCPKLIVNGFLYLGLRKWALETEESNTEYICRVYPVIYYTERNHILFWKKWRELHPETETQ